VEGKRRGKRRMIRETGKREREKGGGAGDHWA